jgi:hypothetical protein
MSKRIRSWFEHFESHASNQALAIGVLNGILVVACLLLAHPFAETGFMDDWSYVKTAEIFAHTGKVVYNGWATAMLGWEIPWGALFIRIFGDSFFAARLSTLPLVVGCIALFQICAVRFRILPRNAFIGGLTLGLSPAFMPLAASYMTDIGGVFALLVCLFMCQRAVLSKTNRGTIYWLFLAATTNVIGGTARQIIWIGALAMVPGTAWFLRRRRGVLIAAAVALIVSMLSIWLLRHWFNYQPYAVPEHARFALNASALLSYCTQLLRIGLCLCMLLLPVLIAWLPGVVRLRGRPLILFVTAIAVASAAFSYQVHAHHTRYWLMPWLQNIVSTQGIWSSQVTPEPLGWGEMAGVAPVTLGVFARACISVVVALTAAAFAVQVDWRGLLSAIKNDYDSGPRGRSAEAGFLEPAAMVWTIFPTLVAYFILLAPRAVRAMIFDRYLVPLMPFLLIIILHLYQRRIAPRLPTISIVVLLIFALYAEAGLHDWFALFRADEAAIQRLHDDGVPRSDIHGTWESDSEYQIETQGHMNDDSFYVPAHSFRPREPQKVPVDCMDPLFVRTPAINARYIVAYSPLPCFQDSRLPPITYHAWLPPFTRKLYILRDAALK